MIHWRIEKVFISDLRFVSEFVEWSVPSRTFAVEIAFRDEPLETAFETNGLQTGAIHQVPSAMAFTAFRAKSTAASGIA
jgi:hypothetical protein